MNPHPNIWFAGDVHGDIRHIFRTIERVGKPDAVILLGDLEAEADLVEWFEPLRQLGVVVRFIHGNHDTDRKELWERLAGSHYWGWNLDGRVEHIAGVRIAGLGGVFREKIWHPPEEPLFTSYTEWEASLAPHWMTDSEKHQKAALFASQRLTHSSSIFPGTIDRLAALDADILVTHEAPGAHAHGFAVIDDLAAAQGATRLFHGHHHERVRYPVSGDLEAFGVGYREIVGLDGDLVCATEGIDSYG